MQRYGSGVRARGLSAARRAMAGLAVVSALAAGRGLADEVCAPTQLGKLIAADGATNDWFGSAVACSEDTAIVGARRDSDAGSSSGSAYVFVSAGGNWVQQAKLVAGDGGAGHEFGWSAALEGDTALVGAIGTGSHGAAYVYTRSGTVWTQQAKLEADDAGAGDEFGWAVALDGDTALISARHDGTGSAYVFVRAGGVWTQQAKLTAAEALGSFGRSVALDGGTAVIGSIADDDAGQQSGAAYVFVRSGGVWTQQARLTASDGAADDLFGYSVGLEGDTALIGAQYDDDGGANSGSVYVFGRSGGNWTEEAKLTASDAAANTWFGCAIAQSGERALIGANFNAGWAYLFTREGGVWSQRAKFHGVDTAAGDQFGYAVGLSGQVGCGAAPFNFGSAPASGAAYVFDLTCAGFPGDFDGDGEVGLVDFATLSVCFGGAGVMVPPAGCTAEEFAACDLDGDGDVDLADFSSFSILIGG